MPVFDLKKASSAAAESKKYELIDITLIDPNPNQPRRTFDEDSLKELAESIRQVGLIQPLLVRKNGGRYELVAGERRLRASKMIGLTKVECIVQKDMREERSAMVALIENLQREDLHFIEEAECYASLLEIYGLTQEELAERLGKSQSFIANKLRLLKLSPAVQIALSEASLTERHARALLQLRDEALQLSAIEKIGEKGMSVKETEAFVEKTLNSRFDAREAGAKPRPLILRMVKDYRLFMNSINASVNQLREAGMVVLVEQSDRPDGVDIAIHVTRP